MRTSRDSTQVAEHVHCGCHVTQDALDGAALRRLREALPDWCQSIELGLDPPFEVSVVVVEVPGYATSFPTGEGATIAEAADKCRRAVREALTSG